MTIEELNTIRDNIYKQLYINKNGKLQAPKSMFRNFHKKAAIAYRKYGKEKDAIAAEILSNK